MPELPEGQPVSLALRGLAIREAREWDAGAHVAAVEAAAAAAAAEAKRRRDLELGALAVAAAVAVGGALWWRYRD